MPTVKSLSRKIDHRQSLLRNLATSLILYEEIKTTKAKAREVKRIVEKLISRTKKDKSPLNARRYLLGYFFDKNATKKMFEVIIPRFKKVDSGFVKIIRLGSRLGDGAEMVVLKIAEPNKIESTPEESKEKKEDIGAENGRDKKVSQKADANQAKK